MNIVLCLLLFLSITCQAFNTANKHIIDCDIKSVENNLHLTLTCGRDYKRTDLFNVYNFVSCSNSANFMKSDVHSMNFEDCYQPTIPANIYRRYPNLQKFNVSHLHLEILPTDWSTKLSQLIASHNNFTNFPKLEPSSKLTIIDLSHNVIRSIDSSSIPAENHIKSLDLSHNEIDQLHVNSFENFNEITKLHLSNNRIKEIPSFLFHKTVQLIDLDLSSNLIETIDEFAFVGDFNLHKLNLAKNRLSVFKRGIFEHHTNLSVLNISGNQIINFNGNTFKTMEWLKTLDLSNNLIKNLNPILFLKLKNVENLNLSRNSLDEIDSLTFLRMKKLKSIDLSGNLLTKLNAYVFSAAIQSNLVWISIADNQLTELIGFTSDFFPHLKIIGLDRNRFSCSYLKGIFKMVEWKQMEFSNRIECKSSDDHVVVEKKEPVKKEYTHLPERKNDDNTRETKKMPSKKRVEGFAFNTAEKISRQRDTIFYRILPFCVIILILYSILDSMHSKKTKTT